jgi:hypothetical protein
MYRIVLHCIVSYYILSATFLSIHTLSLIFFLLAANACVSVLSVLSKECPLGLIDTSNELQEVTVHHILNVAVILLVHFFFFKVVCLVTRCHVALKLNANFCDWINFDFLADSHQMYSLLDFTSTLTFRNCHILSFKFIHNKL